MTTPATLPASTNGHVNSMIYAETAGYNDATIEQRIHWPRFQCACPDCTAAYFLGQSIAVDSLLLRTFPYTR